MQFFGQDFFKFIILGDTLRLLINNTNYKIAYQNGIEAPVGPPEKILKNLFRCKNLIVFWALTLCLSPGFIWCEILTKI